MIQQLPLRFAIATALIASLCGELHTQITCPPGEYSPKGLEWEIPFNFPTMASLTGESYNLTWDCNRKSFCFAPTHGPDGPSIPPQWAGIDLSGWKVAAMDPNEMIGFRGDTDVYPCDGPNASPSCQTIFINADLFKDPIDAAVTLMHEVYHVEIARSFPSFDALYHWNICAAGQPKATEQSNPNCFPCYWANEQSAACAAAHAFCCALNAAAQADPPLPPDELDDLGRAADIAREACAARTNKLPDAHLYCCQEAELSASQKPPAATSPPDSCPAPFDCPSPLMEMEPPEEQE